MKILKDLTFDQTRKIAIPDKGKLVMIEIKQILYCAAQGNYTIFHLFDGNKYTSSYTLKSTYEKLKDFGFISISKSFAINLNGIHSIVQKRSTSVIMANGEELKVSRNCKGTLLKVLFGLALLLLDGELLELVW
jgi:Response regulator of the LytR/AlgR family